MAFPEQPYLKGRSLSACPHTPLTPQVCCSAREEIPFPIFIRLCVLRWFPLTTVMCREPLCLIRVLSSSGRCLAPPRKALPLLHRSYGLMRPAENLSLSQAFPLYSESLQVAAS